MSLPTGYRLLIHPGSDLTPETEAERQRIIDAAKNWDGGPLRLPGTRLPRHLDTNEAGGFGHRSGGAFIGSGRVNCPACGTELLPVFSLDTSDPRVGETVDWPLPRFELPVCPGCMFDHLDYFVDFSTAPLQIIQSGLKAGSEFDFPIASPYETRDVTLRPLRPDEYPGDDELADVASPAHQIGGIPPRWFSDYRDTNCCRCAQPMRYAAVIDYDDTNVPLFDAETRAPCALCIGDMKSYYVFTCADCLMLGYRYAMYWRAKFEARNAKQTQISRRPRSQKEHER